MPLTSIDWVVIIAYLLINLLISIYYRRRASGNTEEFFISGRNVSWMPSWKSWLRRRARPANQVTALGWTP